MKTVFESPYLRHRLTEGRAYPSPQGEELIQKKASDTPQLLPEFVDLEDFLFGFLDGASFLGNQQCLSAMEGVIFYGFEIVKYREV